jgi:hypothetical protein
MPLDTQLLEQLQQNNAGLTSLDLSSQSLTEQDIAQLAQALSTNTNLTSLDISYNRIGAEGAKALSTNNSLTSLDVGWNEIGAEGAKALSTNTCLTSLDVSRNQIGAEGAKALSTNTRLTSLDIGCNQIGAEGAKALSTNTRLTSLDVSVNQIGDIGAKAFSTNTHLTSLDASDNQIGDESYQQIAQKLAANQERQRQRRNGFILTLDKGFSKAHALAGTPSLPLAPELLGHIGAFLDASFYLQLVHIKHPAHIGKTGQQVYQCVLLLLHQLATGQVTQGSISERKPRARQALDYHQHLLFKPAIDSDVVEPPAEKPRREPEKLCAIL